MIKRASAFGTLVLEERIVKEIRISSPEESQKIETESAILLEYPRQEAVTLSLYSSPGIASSRGPLG